ncbi:MAG TPA: DUF2961 domain-containing protein [Phycisphaerae bacterium]|nr:DUF2961 domain-containing protein [Phycisphaerae bacterium]HNU46940.1 DUF2961 domain-containing protein [Phycisphaerae bacterium]
MHRKNGVGYVLPAGLLLGLLIGGCVTAPRVITTESLLYEMTDLTALTQFPNPPYTCKQFSSFDRAAVAPDKDWFANADAGQFLRVEERDGRKEHVLMDAAGPGAIVRIWSANPKGNIRIYLDESPTPTLEAPLSDLLGGSLPGVPLPIAGTRSRGWNSYFPIPYARHCEVTCDEGGFYYHVNYRTYARGTDVRTFSLQDLQSLSGAVQQSAAKLADPRCGGAPPEDRNVQSFGSQLNPGDVYAVADLKGPQAVCEWVVNLTSPDHVQALRQVVLTMTFDGQRTVEVPIGDFFGAAPGFNTYASLPLGVTDQREMWCHWVMPFAKSARIELRNTGLRPAIVLGRFATMPYDWTRASMHFHAGWRAQFEVPTRPMVDWNYLTTQGRGAFVGAAFTIANPVKNWWGEGDEKIYVDGETFPSHFGTGTEDYYGYAWGSPERFTHAYHNQPRCDGPGNYGYSSVNRWHVMDRITFHKNLRFDMELWHWVDPCTLPVISVTAYWYARPGATDGFAALESADLRVPEVPPYVPPRVAGALEGEEMRILEKVGTVEPQDIDGCSNEQHLWWREGQQVGDKLVLGFPAPAAGKYHVFGQFVKSYDYAIVELMVNDDPHTSGVDLYSPRVEKSEEINLGTFELGAGENRLSVEITGLNPASKPAYMFGLDYLRLEPVP